MGDQSANVPPMDLDAVQFPPVIEKLLSDLKGDRKRLARDKAFNDPAQMRNFVSLHLYPRLDETVRLFGVMLMELYQIAGSNANELRRLHGFVVNQLNEMGADIDARDDLPGVRPEVLDEFQQAFYALGTHLQEKYPDDKDTQDRFNAVADVVAEMVRNLMDGAYDDEDDEGDYEGDEDDDLEDVTGEFGDEDDGDGDDAKDSEDKAGADDQADADEADAEEESDG